MLAGGGIHCFRVTAATDKDGVEVKERPVTVPDLFATIYSAVGVAPKKKNVSPLGRPIALSDKGVEGRPLAPFAFGPHISAIPGPAWVGERPFFSDQRVLLTNFVPPLHF